ncbi:MULTISPECIES: hypothetical protein [Asticcacaulis]|uniref:hypothetical protein n=1 Tax=Asticcacaulis TaxID=76890 RepID=UPI001AE61CA4|nr:MULTISPECIES: hypothetical protein [Asticcacaulis]MBP2159619.1 hypothetical protein [Asticcacaulis solisilvae]MDR6800554.1 hypothetical protein [Asticcacaulis sp. BE141]
MTEPNMNASSATPIDTVEYDGQPSEFARAGLQSLEGAVAEAIDRKRRLGQYWVGWDGKKPVKIYPENSVDSAAE